MRRILRQFAYHYGQGGTRGLLRKVGGRTRQICWSESQWVIYVRALADDVPRVGDSLIRRELGFRELLDLGYFKVRSFPEEIIRRFDDRNVCHGFYLGDLLATIGWSSADYLELDRNVRLPCPGGAGLFDFYTFEEHRSRGYYTNALMQLAAALRNAGFARAYIAVDPGNEPSVKGIRRAGFRPALQVTRRWRFGMATIIRRAGVPASVV